MAYLVLPNTVLTDPADKTEVEANFAAVKATLNGGIDSDNISSLNVDKLTGQYYELILVQEMDYSTNAATTQHTFVVPGLSETYSIGFSSTMCSHLGTSDGTITLSMGAWDGAAAWTAVTTGATTTINGAVESLLTTGSTSLVSGQAIRATVVTPGTGTAGAKLTISVQLRRKIHT